MKALHIILAGVLCAGLGACGRPSYPAHRVEQASRELLKKEYGLDGAARLVGGTLYLDVRLPGLTTTDTKKLEATVEKIQGAVMTVTRIALSSDAPIRFIVVTGSDPSWQIGVRIVGYLQDVKDYFYQRISRGDYTERTIFDLEFGLAAQALDPAGGGASVSVSSASAGAVSARADLTLDEFAGQLIVSQFNMANRGNPFLSVVLENTKLKFIALRDRELVVQAARGIAADVQPLVEKILREQAVKIAGKYASVHIRQIRVVADGAQPVIVDVPPPVQPLKK